MTALATSLCASISPQRHIGLRKLIPLKYMKHFANMMNGNKLLGLKAGATHRRFIVLAVTEGSSKSGSADDRIPSWAKPDSDEPPPWARDERASRPEFVIPFYAYLLASVVTAIAAIGSIFEYINQKPVFGVLSSDSVFYTPLLGFFALTGIPTSALLWFKSVKVANKEAEEQDRRDGYS